MNKKLFSTLIAVATIAFLAIGCQSTGGKSGAERKIEKPVPLSQQEQSIEIEFDPATGRTNWAKFTSVTNTYGTNYAGQFYIAEHVESRKKIGARYFIGGGEFKDFETVGVDAIGTTNRTTVGSAASKVEVDALKATVEGFGVILQKAIEAGKGVKTVNPQPAAP